MCACVQTCVQTCMQKCVKTGADVCSTAGSAADRHPIPPAPRFHIGIADGMPSAGMRRCRYSFRSPRQDLPRVVRHTSRGCLYACLYTCPRPCHADVASHVGIHIRTLLQRDLSRGPQVDQEIVVQIHSRVLFFLKITPFTAPPGFSGVFEARVLLRVCACRYLRSGRSR